MKGLRKVKTSVFRPIASFLPFFWVSVPHAMPPLMVRVRRCVLYSCLPFWKGEVVQSAGGDKKVRFQYSKSNPEQTIPQSAIRQTAPFAQRSHGVAARLCPVSFYSLSILSGVPERTSAKSAPTSSTIAFAASSFTSKRTLSSENAPPAESFSPPHSLCRVRNRT